MPAKTNIDQLLDDLYFLNEDGRAHIRRMFDAAPAWSKSALLAYLQSAKRRQDAAIAERLAHDPQFLSDFDAFLNGAFADIAAQYEAQEKQGLDSLLGNQ